MGFDISVCYANVLEIQQAPEELIGVDFELKSWHGGFFVFLDCFVEIVLVVVHHDVQIFFVIVVVSEIGILHRQYIGMAEDL